MPDPVIVFDLETVPDLAAVGLALGLDGKPDAEIRAALGTDFPKTPFHAIACIGALVASFRDGAWGVDALGAPHTGERPEAELIEAFLAKIEALKPKLVTFNGHSFDLPVLRYRAMAHALPAPGLSRRAYFNRFSDDAVDLCDVLSSFVPGALSETARDRQNAEPARQTRRHRRLGDRNLRPRRPHPRGRRLLRKRRRQHLQNLAAV